MHRIIDKARSHTARLLRRLRTGFKPATTPSPPRPTPVIAEPDATQDDNPTCAPMAADTRRSTPGASETSRHGDSAKITSIIEALTLRTREGSIRWRRVGRNSFQTTVSDVTVIVTESRENPLTYHSTHTVEVLNEHGDSIALESTKHRADPEQKRRIERLHASAKSSDTHSKAVLETLLQSLAED